MKPAYLLSIAVAMVLLSGCQTGENTARNEQATIQTPDQTDDTAVEEETPSLTSSDKETEDTTQTPAVAETPHVEPTTVPQPREAGWYMRTVVTAIAPSGAVYTHNTAGIFGELDDSSDGIDSHDIESIGRATLQIRFVNDRLEEGKEYFSDYRSFSKEIPEHESWLFLVKNETGENLSEATFKLAVESPVKVFRRPSDNAFVERKDPSSELLRHLYLIDVDNQKAYTYEEAANTTFSMEKMRVRTFRWVVGEPTQDDYNKPASVQSRALIRPQIEEAPVNSKFGLPPSI